MQPTEESLQPQPSAEDSFLDLLVETLEALDESSRGQFLRQFFHTLAQIDLTKEASIDTWARILQRRNEFSSGVGKKVSLKTALVDVLSSARTLRVPILIEYDDLKKLQINAATDALTGLQNRRLFDEYFDKELNRAKRYGHQMAIVILDLHKLKEVNDRYGHLQGDQVLQMAASTLRRTLRASDFAFRIGGDEFAVLLPQTDPEQALTLCRRVRSIYEAELQPLGLNVGVTLDFGVAVHPQEGDQKSVLMGLADKKLYELKQSGREPSSVIPLETHAPREAEVRERQKPEPVAPGPTVVPDAVPSPVAEFPPNPALFPEHRKWERVSLVGTKAHAVLTDASQKTARVIDLSYGGVALVLEGADDLPEQFSAVLHVPILPPVRVVLRKVYAVMKENGYAHIGCSFVS